MYLFSTGGYDIAASLPSQISPFSTYLQENTTKATQIARQTLQPATRVSPDGLLARGFQERDTHIPLMENSISKLDQDIQTFLQMNKLSQQRNAPADTPFIKKSSLRSDEWDEAEDKLLLESIDKYGIENCEFISDNCFNRTRNAVQCSSRYLYIKLTEDHKKNIPTSDYEIQPTSKKRRAPNQPLHLQEDLKSLKGMPRLVEWDEEEEELLLEGVKTYGDSTWEFISSKCFKGTRSAVQCHARCLYRLTCDPSFQEEAAKIHRICFEDA